METENQHNRITMKKVVKNPVFISTVSTAVAVGVAAVVYTRRRVRSGRLLQMPSAAPLSNISNKIEQFVGDIYLDDSDLGYC